jgi:hypothetical protein
VYRSTVDLKAQMNGLQEILDPLNCSAFNGGGGGGGSGMRQFSPVGPIPTCPPSIALDPPHSKPLTDIPYHHVIPPPPHDATSHYLILHVPSHYSTEYPYPCDLSHVSSHLPVLQSSPSTSSWHTRHPSFTCHLIPQLIRWPFITG